MERLAALVPALIVLGLLTACQQSGPSAAPSTSQHTGSAQVTVTYTVAPGRGGSLYDEGAIPQVTLHADRVGDARELRPAHRLSGEYSGDRTGLLRAVAAGRQEANQS